MERYFIEGSATTPEVDFNPKDGVIKISGRAIPEDAKHFWSPVLSWFFAYSSAPVESTKITFDMAYYNIHSAKQIMFIFYRINDMYKDGFKVEVTWLYEKDDIEMKEAGYDFASLLCFDINIIEKVEELAAVS